MSLYHMTARTLSRSGRSSARQAFRYALRLGKYASRGDLLTTGNGNMPSWSSSDNGAAYWDAADTYERANGRLCKTVEFSLPKELTDAQNAALAAGICAQLAISPDGERLPYSYAVHQRKNGNIHCHLLLSERVNDGYTRTPATWFRRAVPSTSPRPVAEGGARKTASLKSEDWLMDARARVAEIQNQVFQRYFPWIPRLDHRSHAARGLPQTPTKHRGFRRKAQAKGKPGGQPQAEPTPRPEAAQKAQKRPIEAMKSAQVMQAAATVKDAPSAAPERRQGQPQTHRQPQDSDRGPRLR